MAQDRKVFVGGVPQDLNQDDLYAIFSEYAGVKKAWLQKCRITDDGNGGNSCPSQNHRGFGFVIFHDAHAIDDLLGNGASRFIVLRNGAKLEVKRALSSNKMGTENAASTSGSEAGGGNRTNRSQATRPNAANELASSHIPGSNSQRPLNQQGPLLAPQRTRAAVPPDSRAFPPLHAQGPVPAPCYANPAAAGRAGLLGEPAMLDPLAGYGLPPHVGTTRLGGIQPPGLEVGMPPVDSAPGFGAGFSRSEPPLRDAIMRFYYEHCPQKLTERDLIDFICSAYDGREDELDTALREKYGTGLHYPLRSGSRGVRPLSGQRGLLKRMEPGFPDAMGMSLPPKPLRADQDVLGGQYWACPRESEVPSPDLRWVDDIVAGDEAAGEVARLKAEMKHKEEWGGPTQGYVW